MYRKTTFGIKPLGKILQEAGLIELNQILVALLEQSIYTDFKIGEIFALHGWIEQKTADFFAEQFALITRQTYKEKIGYYLTQAGLLSQTQVIEIIKEQKQTKEKFGEIAVKKKWLNQETINFFIKYIYPDNIHIEDLIKIDIEKIAF